MSVIVELALPAREFELGRILQVEGDTSVVLETMVPLGERSIPFFHIQNGRGDFEQTVSGHSSVDDIHVVETHDGEILYALDWRVGADTFFHSLRATDAHLLEATGDARTWAFELRLPSNEALSEFREYCIEAELPTDVKRIYNPTTPDAGPWYGVTTAQREVLVRAVEAGYYSIPRGISTEELAEEFDISDQAVTERLRRGIEGLVTNTLLTAE